MNLEQALEKYLERFGMNFPVMSMRGTPESEIVDLIEQALNTGVPYELAPDDSELPPLY